MKSNKVVELIFEYTFDAQMSQNNRHCAKAIILKLSKSSSIEVIFKRPLDKFRPGVMRLMRVKIYCRHLVIKIVFHRRQKLLRKSYGVRFELHYSNLALEHMFGFHKSNVRDPLWILIDSSIVSNSSPR